MKSFILKLAAFAGVNMLVLSAWYSVLYVQEAPCPIDRSTSCVHMVAHRQHYDLLVLGTSHARSLTVDGNQQRVERILGKRMINLSKTGGAGPLWANIYLDLFYDHGNDVDTILYVVDPWVFASSVWNEALCAVLIHEEPLRIGMFREALVNRVDAKCLLLYARAYLLKDWTFDQCGSRDADEHVLSAVDDFAVAERVRVLYPGDGPREIKEEYLEDLSALVETGKRHGARIFLILPPTLLGDIALMQEFKDALAPLAQAAGIQWRDFSQAVTDPALYTDHDHLNSRGIEVFVRQYIRPLVNRR